MIYTCGYAQHLGRKPNVQATFLEVSDAQPIPHPPFYPAGFAVEITLGIRIQASSPSSPSFAHMADETSTPQFPPEVLRYLEGPSSESRQFDFLIGEWNVEATRYKEDETPALNYRAIWSAKSLNEGRMVMDDFQALAPNGEPISSYVTLRTYSEVTRRWEMVGLQALQPSVAAEWHGVSTDDGMLLDAVASLPNGQRVHTKIRFFEITSDTFSWQSSMSFDHGKTWRKTASLKAKRRS